MFGALGEAESRYALIANLVWQVETAKRQKALQERAVQLVETRFRAGLPSFLDVHEARRAAAGASEAVVAAEGRLARARVLLWRALGGSELPA